MGVINSKNIKGVKGDENNNGFTNPDEENNAEVPDEAPEEALSGDEVEMKKQNNMKKWAPFFKELFKNPDFKVSIKAGIKEKNQNSGDSKLIANEPDIEKYLNGDKDYIDYITDDLDKIYLFNPPETKALFEELTKGSEDQPIRTLSKEITGAALIEKMKEIANKILPNIQRAVKHKGLTEVINYLVDTDEFKKKHKETNISPEKDSIMKGEKSANEAALKKENEPEPEAEPKPNPEEGGDTESIHSGGSSLSGGSLSSRSLSSRSISGGSLSGGSLSGGSIDEGGGVFKTAEEKQYKEFKKGQKADIKEKQILFMKDIPKLNKFIDTNENELMPIYSKSKIGKNVDKSAPKSSIITPLFEAVDSYIKEPDMAGAAGNEAEAPVNDASGNEAAAAAPAAAPAAPAATDAEVPAAPVNDAPAAPVTDAPNPLGGESGTSGGNNTSTTTSAGDQAIQLADMIKETLLKTALETTGLQNPKSSASSNPIEKAIEILPNTFAEHKPSVPQTGGGITSGENEMKKRKKKRGKKPKHINISINVGNKNIIIDETSSSSSNSESSSSHDDTTSISSSSSDDEDNREKKNKNKNKQSKNKQSKNKKGKYVVNNK